MCRKVPRDLWLYVCVHRYSTVYLWCVYVQRQCEDLEEGNRRADGTLSTSLQRQGHRGILATGSATETTSTAHDSYTSPQPYSVRTTGIYIYVYRLQPLPVLAADVEKKKSRVSHVCVCVCVCVCAAGSREAALRSAAYDVVSQQVQEEFHPPPPPPEFLSTTRTDYHKGQRSAAAAAAVRTI